MSKMRTFRFASSKAQAEFELPEDLVKGLVAEKGVQVVRAKGLDVVPTVPNTPVRPRPMTAEQWSKAF